VASNRSVDFLQEQRRSKTHRHSSPNMHNNSTNSVDAVNFEQTEIDTVPNIVEAQIALDDEKEPIIFVICKGMRDKFMKFITTLGQSFFISRQ